jgi:hypothetical protein
MFVPIYYALAFILCILRFFNQFCCASSVDICFSFPLFSYAVTSRLCPLLPIPPKSRYNLLYDAISGNRNFASNRKHGSIRGTTPFKNTSPSTLIVDPPFFHISPFCQSCSFLSFSRKYDLDTRTASHSCRSV